MLSNALTNALVAVRARYFLLLGHLVAINNNFVRILTEDNI